MKMKSKIFFIVLTTFFLGVYYFNNSKRTEKTKRLSESEFYNTYYNTNDLILVNVWATWCKYCLVEFPDLEKVKPQYNLKFVSISIDEDTIRLKKFLEKNPIVKDRDITLKNLDYRDSICRKIELTGYTNPLEVFANTKTIPYTVLIKNKKILYKAIDDLDIDSLNAIISKNK